MSVFSAAEITGAELFGAALESREITFRPKGPRPGRHTFDVAKLRASAGSSCLVFQTIAPPLFFAPSGSQLTIKGGTHVEWSPPADYLTEVWGPALSRMGLRTTITNPLKGYYPIGGGVLESNITPALAPLKSIEITDRGRLTRLSVRSAVSNLPLNIAERQLASALSALGGFENITGALLDAPSPGRGTYVFILAEFENVKAGFSALGARGKRAEDVGAQAAGRFLAYMKGKGALEAHLTDQIALFMALAEGTSKITTVEITDHLLTNVKVIESFLPVRFDIKGTPGEQGTVSVDGCAFRPVR